MNIIAQAIDKPTGALATTSAGMIAAKTNWLISITNDSMAPFIQFFGGLTVFVVSAWWIRKMFYAIGSDIIEKRDPAKARRWRIAAGLRADDLGV